MCACPAAFWQGLDYKYKLDKWQAERDGSFTAWAHWLQAALALCALALGARTLHHVTGAR